MHHVQQRALRGAVAERPLPQPGGFVAGDRVLVAAKACGCARADSRVQVERSRLKADGHAELELALGAGCAGRQPQSRLDRPAHDALTRGAVALLLDAVFVHLLAAPVAVRRRRVAPAESAVRVAFENLQLRASRCSA
eukprot:2052788-Prymnesium_polylepis.2